MDEINIHSNVKYSLNNIKNKYILKKIFDNITPIKTLDIIFYNKAIQNRLNININDYKNEYFKIEILLTPVHDKYGKFINIQDKDKSFFHIYFNNDIEEIKVDKNNYRENNFIKKIKIEIDYQIDSLAYLFENCECIEKINFTKFKRKDIRYMNSMFKGCSSLKEINLSKIYTDNVIDMNHMFFECSSLKNLNLSKFNINNAIDMSWMFAGCKSLKNLYISNFNINKNTNTEHIFDSCFKLKDKYKLINEMIKNDNESSCTCF